MNWLDAGISYLSPEAGLRRARAREALTDAIRAARNRDKSQSFRRANERLSYAAADTGRRMGGWFRPGTSANAETLQALKMVRDGARAAVRDMPLAAKGMLEFENKAVGTGIRPQARTGNPETNRILDEAFEQWAKLTSYWARQRTSARCIVEAGESLIRHRYRYPGDGVNLLVNGKRFEIPYVPQFIEPDYLDQYKDGTTDTGYIIQGVEFNKLGMRQAYWLFAAHPGDVVNTGWFNRGASQSARVPADSVEHGYRVDRHDQVRGVSWLAPILPTLYDLDGYEDAERIRKRGEACVMAFATVPPAENTETNVVTGTSRVEEFKRIEEMSPGMIMYQPIGSDIKFAQPSTNGGHVEYTVSQQRLVAAGLGMMFELLTGNLSQVSYSSYRGGAISFKDFIEAFQYITLIPFFGDPVYERFFDACKIAGVISPDTVYGVEWGPPAFDLLDREAEAKADELEMRIGGTTFDQMCSRRGWDPEKQYAAIVAWQKRFREDGVVLDCDPSQTARSGVVQQQPSANAA